MFEPAESIFYDVSALDLKAKEKILREAYAVTTDWWVDVLDCRKSFARQTVDMGFEDILSKLTDKWCKFIVIARYDIVEKDHYGEVGFCNMTEDVSYYLWINVSKDDFIKLVENNNLKLRKLNTIKESL